ncbi:hypothetical protein HNP92_001082 [Methanococcus maripaludis]|uniref:Uncharacterized protein n=1 Tax=Methanococcus maripaludis TaxID=39152 RepID=A0A7J9PUN2_METMI|nr:hypothetical protein [Methanococcus maripaludis]MBA2869118.1 hypothetical protein [Methanococcus maripaludis]MBB6401777.1 hypothetical protein [Methanococcus maripaludis]
MKTTALTLLLVFSLVLTSVSGEVINLSENTDLFSEMKAIAMAHSEDLDKIPFATNIAKNERINLNVETGEGNLRAYITVENGIITNFEKGSLENATMNMYTDESTVREILDSDDPVSAAQSALKADKIRMEGVGIVNSIKVSVVNVLMSFF